MKKIHFMTIILSFHFVSCDRDDATNFSGGSPKSDNVASAKYEASYPANPDNPYDSAGRITNELSEVYYLDAYSDTTTSGIIATVEELANSNDDFVSLKDEDYPEITAARIESLRSQPLEVLNQIIEDSKISIDAKMYLLNFAHAMMMFNYSNANAKAVCNYIKQSEAGVLSGTFTELEKKIILTASSIARHGYYFAKTHKRKPRDRDWDLMIGHVVAGTESYEDTTKAIRLAVCVNLTSNYQEQ